MYVTAIVLAAGRGLRFRSKTPKLLAKIDSKPIIIHCLGTLSKHPAIKDIILVVNSQNRRVISEAIRRYRIKKIKALVRGGILRQHSVGEGLKVINPETDLVLIHDGARPFINSSLVSSLLGAAKLSGAAIAATPVKATIKKVISCRSSVVRKYEVKETLNRNELWEAQTPQVFRKDLILASYKRFGNKEVTDDAALVEKLGVKVRVVRGTYFNIKITTPEDLVLAEAILNYVI